MHVLKKCCALLMWMNMFTSVQGGTGCMLEQFKQSDLFDDNFELSSLRQTYNSGDNVSVHCKVGYNGFFKLICSDGKWFHRGDKCKLFSCGQPGDAPFANFTLVKGTDYDFGSKVLYTCLKGYQMTSFTNTRNCLQGGWDGDLPECEPILCPPLLDLDIARVLVDGDIDQPTFNSVLQFSCRNKGDDLIGATQLNCEENGQWNGTAPICREISCEKPQKDSIRVEGEKATYKENEVLRYSCNPGYKKVDGRPAVCRKLGVSTQWTPMPECELITCKLSPNPRGTTYDPENQIIFTPRQSVRVSCGEKEWVKSTVLQSAELRCQNTGLWDFEPVCQPVTCSKQAEHVYNWEYTRYNTLTMDATLRYQCYDGYEATSPRATCTRRGWEPQPLCKERTCNKPAIKNAEITDSDPKDNYRHNDRVEFRCTYDPEMTFTVTCYYGTSWYGQRSCKEKPCTTQPDFINSEMVDNRRPLYGDRALVRFRCTGERVEFWVTCKAGEWESERLCEKKTCSTPPVYENAELLDQRRNTYVHNEEVQLKCKGEEEPFTVSCQAGEWMPKHECPECGSTAVLNGFSHLHNKKLYHTCSEGFKLLTKGWWAEASCVNGKWNTQECIASSDCGPLPTIPNLNVKSERKRFQEEETISIFCEPGHQNQHPDLKALTCKKGKWDAKGVDFKQICTPIENKCSVPPKMKNAVILAPFEKEYLSDTTLTYKCAANFIMEGDNTIQCRNGTWQGDTTTCKSK